MTRATIQTAFEKPEIGFKFEDSSPVDGQPRVMGKAKNGLALMELIGPPENLTSATVLVGTPKDAPQALVENAVYMLGLVKLAAPGWKEGPDWVSENLKIAVETGSAETYHENLHISLMASKQLGMIMLTVKARG